MKISYHRWQEAQNFELNDWRHQPDIITLELTEAKQKYYEIFRSLENRLHLGRNSKILDLGCGPTCISLFIRKGQHYGVEPLADKLNLKNQLKDIKIHTGTGEKIPFEPQKFDLVICRNVIDHTYNPDQVILEISRVVKSTGHLFLAGYVYHPFVNFVKNMAEFFYFLRNIGHPHTYTPTTLAILAQKKFKIVRTWTIHTGRDPHDFGKIQKSSDQIPLVQRIIVFVNNIVLRHTWFVKEIAFLCCKIDA